jgi:hypothetical protein
MPFERPATVNEPSDKFPAQSFAVRDGSKTLDFDLSALAIDGSWTFPAPGSADSGKYLKGDGTWTTVSGLSPITNNLILGNISGSTALPVGITASQVLDTITSTQGNIVFRGASAWSALTTGTTGSILRTNGAAANPSWATLTSIIDLIGSTRGNVLFRGASAWSALAVGTTGQLLRTNGAGADPSWASLTNIVDLIGSTQGQILFRGASSWSVLATGTTGNILRTNGAGANPSWDTISNILDTISNTHGTIVFRGASGWSALAVGTTGQLLRTNGAAADPSWANLATILDLIGSTQGQILFRGASGWGVLSAGTAGQVLQTNGAAANPSWATLGSVVLKSKTGGESVTSSTTVQNDDHLNFDIPANQTWRAVYELFATSATSTNLRMKFLVPSGATATATVYSIASNRRYDDFSDATVENVHNYADSTTATLPQATRIVLRVVNGANAGTVTFQWAQGTSSATSLTIRSSSGLIAGRES